MEFPAGGGGGGFARPKNLKKHLRLNWNSQRGGGGSLRKNAFHVGGIDILWNYTMFKKLFYPLLYLIYSSRLQLYM